MYTQKNTLERTRYQCSRPDPSQEFQDKLQCGPTALERTITQGNTPALPTGRPCQPTQHQLHDPRTAMLGDLKTGIPVHRNRL